MHRLQERGPLAPLSASTRPFGRSDRRSARLVVAGLIALVTVVADQITKTLALDHLASGPRHLLGPFSLALTFNSGAAFSFASGFPAEIIVIGLLALLALLWLARSSSGVLMILGVGLLLGGALGNLSDRLFRAHHGEVIDFIHTGFWPTFNVADSAITIGCVLLVIAYWRKERSSAQLQKGSERPAAQRAGVKDP